MNDNLITNKLGAINSLQISHMGDIPAGSYTSEDYFLIKNITDTEITVDIKLVNNDDFISTILYPGWNVEMVTAIRNVTVNTLQYGY